jgi:nucleoside-diphosphate-sugar epimerase
MILVTGATGLVGSRLVFDLIDQGQMVRALKRPTSDLAFIKRVFKYYSPERGIAHFEKIEWFEGDVLDTESLLQAMLGIETVYHCAALVSYRPQDYQALIDTNVSGTENVVNICLTSNVKKLAYISSIAALGRAPKDQLINENTEWKPGEIASNYSLSKFLAEQEVWRGVAEGLNALVVQPSIILGPAKSDQSSGMMMAMLRKGVSYYPGGTAGFVDVRDVSKMTLALTSDPRAENENFILSGENQNYKDLLTTSAEVFGNKPPTIKTPKWMLEVAWVLSAVGNLFGAKAKITRETARSASRISRFDNSKVIEKTNLKFIGVRASLEYYRAFFS